MQVALYNAYHVVCRPYIQCGVKTKLFPFKI